MYNEFDIDSNQIGNKGCEHLSKADWTQLKTLNLSTAHMI